MRSCQHGLSLKEIYKQDDFIEFVYQSVKRVLKINVVDDNAFSGWVLSEKDQAADGGSSVPSLDLEDGTPYKVFCIKDMLDIDYYYHPVDFNI